MKVIQLPETDSTNSWIGRHEEMLPSPCMVYCHTQLAGRGQRGNSWEAEPGKNFTGSVLFHPQNFPAMDQFIISEAIALAVVSLLKEHGIEAKVKWPNDIYAGNRKICGILVEHVVTGRNISRTIAGIGLNVNQVIFLSDAPNPVSMKMITGKEYDPGEISLELAGFIDDFLTKTDNGERFHSAFMEKLWRNDGTFYPFHDRNAGQLINARIDNVAPNGLLTLTTSEGEKREFAFKEVEFILTGEDTTSLQGRSDI